MQRRCGHKTVVGKHVAGRTGGELASSVICAKKEGAQRWGDRCASPHRCMPGAGARVWCRCRCTCGRGRGGGATRVEGTARARGGGDTGENTGENTAGLRLI